MKIILTGGGTLGSVSPIIAAIQELQVQNSRIEILWVGTKKGPENNLVSYYNFTYKQIPAGKLRRYFSFQNLTDAIKILLGLIKSCWLIFKFKPDIIIGAGGFVQVPIIYATGLFFKKTKIIIHQQDVKKGLANSLCAKFADKITVSIKKSLSDFPKDKTVLTGNPYRSDILTGDINKASKIFNLTLDLPTVLILGGGIGALSLNRLIVKSLNKLTKFCQIIHVAGKNKLIDHPLNPNYHIYEFLTDKLRHAYAAADLVISRAGFSTLTELSVLAKPAILIPMPASHQEQNAEFFAEQKAVIVLQQKILTPDNLAKTVNNLLLNRELRFELSNNINKIMPSNATEMFIKEIAGMMDSNIINVKNW